DYSRGTARQRSFHERRTSASRQKPQVPCGGVGLMTRGRPASLGPDSPSRVMVVGSGWHFTSGISHYTYRLSTALAEAYAVSALLMRRLLPQRLYPGAARVGADVTEAACPEQMPVYDGVDWSWGRSMTGALKFLEEQRPSVLILQWWTGAVLHTYLRL